MRTACLFTSESLHDGAETGSALRLYQNEQLERDGYLSFDHFVSTEDVEPIRIVLQRLWQERVGYEQGALFDFVGGGDGATASFPQILRPSDLAAELKKTKFFNEATELAKSVLGPGARFAADHALIKPAHVGPITPWHQDDSFRDPSMDGHEISIWLALQPVDLNNGCLQFIPGSHKGAILPHRSPGGNTRVHALECFEGFDPAQAVACSLPTGGCTVHTGRTLHYAGPNHSDHHRLVYVLIFDLPPTPAAVVREAPWLAGRRTERDEREQAWRRKGGVFVQQWRRLRRIDFSRPDQVRYLLNRITSAVLKKMTP